MRAAAVIAAAILLTACPGNQPENEAQNSPPRSSATSGQDPHTQAASPQKDFPGSRVANAATQAVEVQLTEFGIQIPDTIAKGHQRLQIANAGKETHSFVIEGPGVQTRLSSDLMRGDTAEITVDLQPGTYTVFCPIDGHRGKGMQKTVTVK